MPGGSFGRGRGWRRGGNNRGNYRRPWGRGRGAKRGRGSPEYANDGDNFDDSSIAEENNPGPAGDDTYVGNVGAVDAQRQFQRKNRRKNVNNQPRELLNDGGSSSDDEVFVPSKRKGEIRLKHVVPDWPDYLPFSRYKRGGYLAKVVAAFTEFFKQNSDWQKSAMQRGHFFLDFEAITTNPIITGDDALGPNFSLAFTDSPAETLAAISLAAHQVAFIEQNLDISDEDKQRAICEGVYPLVARIFNFGPPIPFRTLRADSFAKLVVVCGTVVRMSSVRPTCVELAFKCLSCGQETVLPLSDGATAADKSQPTKCRPVNGGSGPRCLGRTFVSCPHSLNTLSVDSRTIRIQEVASNDDEARDAIPRCIDVELFRELADQCSPGDVVTVCGIVKLRPAKEFSGRNVEDSSEFRLTIEANYLKHHSDNNTVNSSQNLDVEQLTTKQSEFSESDLELFREIKSEPNLFRLLVQSLCPEIYGHELIKAGLILALFAGKSEGNASSARVVEGTSQAKDTAPPDGPASSTGESRPNIHVLLVGDPGLGKSQLLRSLSDCAPRVVYVCGSSASVAGLGVAVNRDRSTLQAGALVLADRGICCVDELDKMGGQEAVLLEVMEQQTLSVAKAGFVCSLPARCSIIAAANPSGGRYNYDRSVTENIRLPGGGALLSRFDLVFCLLDRHDTEHDRLLSKHVMAAYGSNSNTGHSGRFSNSSLGCAISQSSGSVCGGKALQRRLISEEQLDLLPHSLLRKYVSFAIQTVQPRLSPAAAVLLKNFYLDMRGRAQGYADAPVTTRQLESLMRLAECRARLELREEVAESDAKDVIDLMTDTLPDVFANKSGDLVSLRLTGAPAKGRQTIIRRLVPLLQNHCQLIGSNLITRVDIAKVATQMRLSSDKLAEVIEVLNDQGYLIKKSGGQYQLQSSTF